MTLVLKKVESTEDTNRFIHFPHQIYSSESLWVAPLDSERKKFLSPQINPFFEHAEAEYFLALSTDGKTLGRIAAIVDHDHNRFHKENTGFFGMYECVNDAEVSTLLFNAAEQWCRGKKMDRMRGPFNLSTNHECGLLVENFEDPPVLGIPYNPPYYADLLHQWGLKKTKDLISFNLQLNQIPEYLQRAVSLIQKRNRFTIRCLQMDRFSREIDTLWDIYNSAWEANWGFVPMNRTEFVFAAQEMKPIVDPRVCFIAEMNGEPVGFSLALPDVNQALKPMKGKLFPFGWLKFILGKRRINRFRVITLGVKKQYQRLGIDAYFYYATYKQLMEINIFQVDMSWVLEDNQAIIGPIEKIGGVPYKRHRIYERNLTH
jgi:GNAT superfamily N-acetyltransferase